MRWLWGWPSRCMPVGWARVGGSVLLSHVVPGGEQSGVVLFGHPCRS